MKILVAEDDPHTRRGLAELFRGEGWETATARDGEEALRLFDAEKPDLICLDVMMPKINGYDVCRRLRQSGSRVAVLFISAKSEEIDTVLGLELGADDFIVKPFGAKAVVARVRAVARRVAASKPRAEGPSEFVMGPFRIVPGELRAWRGERCLDLSTRDVKILALLYRERGRVVTRDQLSDEAWGLNHFPGSRSLDQHICQLRKRLGDDAEAAAIIRTVHGAGYRFDG